MRFTFIIFISFVFYACSSNSKKTCNEKNKAFSSFCNEFKLIKNLKIDSLCFVEIVRKNPYTLIDINNIKLIKSVFLDEKCNKYTKYIPYSVGRIKNNEKTTSLLFYLVLNPKCQYDGYENFFLLCNYDSRAKLVSEKIIGKRYIVFGEEEYSYFELINSEKIIQEKINSYENELGETIVEKSKDTIYF